MKLTPEQMQLMLYFMESILELYSFGGEYNKIISFIKTLDLTDADTSSLRIIDAVVHPKTRYNIDDPRSGYNFNNKWEGE